MYASKADLDKLRFGDRLPAGHYVFLEVSDTGDGIVSENLGMIFEPFFTTKVSGQGIGLATVATAVQKYRAGLGVHSEVGKGTTFRILFPAIDQT